MYNLNYAPTTLGVQSRREIICGGTRKRKRLNNAALKNKGTYWIRGWMGPRAGLDFFLEKVNSPLELLFRTTYTYLVSGVSYRHIQWKQRSGQPLLLLSKCLLCPWCTLCLQVDLGSVIDLFQSSLKSYVYKAQKTFVILIYYEYFNKQKTVRHNSSKI
jgi:hypothetical protein